MKKRFKQAEIFLFIVSLLFSISFPIKAQSNSNPVYSCSYIPHTHQASCFDEAGNRICHQADYVLHKHDANCYDDSGNLWCTLQENVQEEHIHSSDCFYENGQYKCSQDQRTYHQHSSQCIHIENVPVKENIEEKDVLSLDESSKDESGDETEKNQETKKEEFVESLKFENDSYTLEVLNSKIPASAKIDINIEENPSWLKVETSKEVVKESQKEQEEENTKSNEKTTTSYEVFNLTFKDGDKTIALPEPSSVTLTIKENAENENIYSLYSVDSNDELSLLKVKEEQSKDPLILSFELPENEKFVLEKTEKSEETSPKEEMDEEITEAAEPSQEEASEDEKAGDYVLGLKNQNGQVIQRIFLDKNGSVTLPSAPFDPIPEGSKFVGWSQARNYATSPSAWKDYPLYVPGGTFVWPGNTTGNYIELYPIIAQSGANTDTYFFIRLDGIIPNEPASFPNSSYTDGIVVKGALDYLCNMVNVMGIPVGQGQPILKQPSNEQMAQKINAKASKIGFGAVVIDGKMYKAKSVSGVMVPINSKGEQISPDSSEKIELSVLWYVIKNENRWHADGVLLESDKVSLTYSPGKVSTGEVTNMPNGLELDTGTTVHVGNNLNKPNVTPSTPVRQGYEFIGWYDEENRAFYQNGETFTIEKDTVLQAMWKPGVDNSLMIYKTNNKDTGIPHAQFKISERRTATGSFIPLETKLETNAQGQAFYDGLNVDYIYKVEEVKPPFGYKKTSDFYFRFQYRNNQLEAYLCDPFGKEKSYDHISLRSYLQNGKILVNIGVFDEFYTTKVSFKKYGHDNNPLENAGFMVSKKDHTTLEFDLRQGTSNADGQVLFDLEDELVLPDGEYEIQENKAPDGYALISNPITFKVENGKVIWDENIPKTMAACSYDSNKDRYTIEIFDRLQQALPTTGSKDGQKMKNTSILLFAEGLLLSAVGLVFFKKQKKEV